MRYIVRPTDTRTAFNEGSRPPLDLLPPELASKILERDRIMQQQSEAQHLLSELSSEVATNAATQADDLAAATAARAGKPVPAPKARPKLEKDRDAASHALTAQNAAFAEINGELDTLVGEIFWAGAEEAAAVRAKTRAAIEAKATDLADAVLGAVTATAVRDWMRHGTYNTTAYTWPTEFLDLEHYGLSRGNTRPVDVRAVLIAAATAVLEEEGDE